MFVGVFDAGGVFAGVQGAAHGQAGCGGGAAVQVQDDLVGLEGSAAPVHGDLAEEPALDLFHLLVPGGRWLTVTRRPVWAANAASSIFQARTREPFEPPPSAQIRSLWALG